MTLMKTILFLTVLASFVGCSSANKNETQAATPTPTATATTPAATATETKTKSEKTDAKKMTRPTKVAKSDSNAKEVKCTSGSDERMLAIAAKGEGCELSYTKSGETKPIATQMVGDGRCVEVMKNVRTKLEGAQFSCQ